MESRFTPLLSTNYVPSKDELDEIHKLLVDPVDQLNGFDAEIARLQTIIDELSLKWKRLHDDIVRHRNLTAPLRRIPQEILQEIFIHCLPVHHNAVMSCHEAPLLLGRVCSQWRSVAFSTPRLWSSIHIVATEDAPTWGPPSWGSWSNQNQGSDLNRDIVEAVEAWLSRSGSLPLYITLFQPSYVYLSPGYGDQLITKLIRFSPRWKNISLIISPVSYPPLSSLSHEAVPLLESFSFHDCTNNPSPQLSIQSPFDVFRAPRMRAASVFHVGIIPESIDWSRLTSISLECHGHGIDELTPTKALAILRKSPNLSHCALEFGWSDWDPFDDHRVVIMPSLQTLIIMEGGATLNLFFGQLLFPALVNLEFSVASPRTPHVTDAPEEPSICVLLARLEFLGELTLSVNNLPDTTLIKCLQYTSFITRLSILSPPQPDTWHNGWPSSTNIWQPLNNEVVTFLTPVDSGDRPLVCPRLKILECNPGIVSDAVLLTFIQQRTTHALAHNVEPLERVDIVFSRQKEIDILAALPPEVLAETTVNLEYHEAPVFWRNLSPRAGLQDPGRLKLPTKASKYIYHQGS